LSLKANAESSQPKIDENFFVRTPLNKRTVASYKKNLWPENTLVKGVCPQTSLRGPLPPNGAQKASGLSKSCLPLEAPSCIRRHHRGETGDQAK